MTTRHRRLASVLFAFLALAAEATHREGRLNTTRPIVRAFVGQWTLFGHHEHIDIDLEPDMTFTATAWHASSRNGPRQGFRWAGKGYWGVRDGKLSLVRTHSRTKNNVTWFWTKNPRAIFRNKEILDITTTEIVLDMGPPMKRQK